MKLKKLFLSILFCLSCGWIGSLVTTQAIPTWYAALNKPSFNPPNWIFGPVWTILYVLQGIVLHRIWIRDNTHERRTLLGLFFFQLFLNFVWSFLFFGLKSPEFALVDIIILLVIICVLAVKLWKNDKISALLLVPYILWVSFASVLNATIAMRN